MSLHRPLLDYGLAILVQHLQIPRKIPPVLMRIMNSAVGLRALKPLRSPFALLSAEVFNFSYGTGELGKEHARREVRQALESLPRLGIDVEFDDQTISELVDLQTRIDSLGSDKEFEARSAELEDVDFLVKQSVGKYARRMTMSDKEFEEFMRLTREFRNLLRSKLLKEVKA